MNCSRCGSPVYIEEFKLSQEVVISCNFCGYYSAKQFSGMSPKGMPIFEYHLLEPKGVVVTSKGNIQYFNNRQKNTLLKQNGYIGYSYEKDGKWKYQPINSIEINLNSKAAMTLLKER